jgi:cephalosporin-C deacetylase
MAQTDLTIDELWDYRPTVAEPPDFDQFWADQVTRARGRPIDVEVTPVVTPATYADVCDLSFAGHGGDRIRAWLLNPHEVRANAPIVVEYVGYGGGRGDPLEWATWSLAGYPHLIMDTRGQGGGWRVSDTPDPGDDGAPSSKGFLTRGVATPDTHYYTRLFIDAARAVDAARALPGHSGASVLVTGASQGGGLTLAAAHLAGGVLAAAPDVPFLSHIRRGSEITDETPYAELAEYCRVRPREVDQVFRTLSYLDVVNHAKRVSAPGLFSVGLFDQTTPPSTVFAAYHAYAGPKEIRVYPFNGHEGGQVTHLHEKLTFAETVGQQRS